MSIPRRSPALILGSVLGLAALTSCATTAPAVGSAPVAPVILEAPEVPPAVPETPAYASPTGATVDLSAEVQQRTPMTQRPQEHLFTVLLGNRNLNNSDWRNMDSQFSVGLTFAREVADGAIALDFGVYGSGDNSSRFLGMPPVVNTRSDILEFDFGALKMFKLGDSIVRPYLGGGFSLNFVSGRLMVGPFFFDDTDFSPGLYGRGGVAVDVGSGGLLGLDAHYLGLTDMNLGGLSTDIDGWIFSLLFGYMF